MPTSSNVRSFAAIRNVFMVVFPLAGPGVARRRARDFVLAISVRSAPHTGPGVSVREMSTPADPYRQTARELGIGKPHDRCSGCAVDGASTGASKMALWAPRALAARLPTAPPRVHEPAGVPLVCEWKRAVLSNARGPAETVIDGSTRVAPTQEQRRSGAE